MHGNYEGDLADMKTALNQAIDHLHDGFAKVAIAADQLKGATSQIASGSQAVAKGASEQASALEDTSESLKRCRP